MFVGAAQDTGTHRTTDGMTWTAPHCCDSWDALVDDDGSPNRMWAGNNGLWRRRLRTDNGGATYTDWHYIPTSGPPLLQTAQPELRHDSWNPVWVYTNDGAQVWKATIGYGGEWFSQLGTIPTATFVDTIAVKRRSEYVYATKSGGAGDRFWVYDDSGGMFWMWSERGNPAWAANHTIRRVVPHPTNDTIAYVVMRGTSLPASDRVFRALNRGMQWENVTGDLNVKLPVAVQAWDLAVNPLSDTTLYLATEAGAYRTTNGGTTWNPWSNGWPAANLVRSIRADVIDAVVRVTAGTYGRGVWTREEGDD